MNCENCERLERELLSALAAIEKHNNAPPPDCPWGKIDVDKSDAQQTGGMATVHDYMKMRGTPTL